MCTGVNMFDFINQCVENSTSIFHTCYYGNSILGWLSSLFIILFSFIIGKILYWFFGNVVKDLTSKTEKKFDDVLVDTIEEPIVLFVVLIGIFISSLILNLNDSTRVIFWNIYQALIVFNFTWCLVRLVDAVFEHHIAPLMEKSQNKIDDVVLPVLQRGSKVVLWILAVIISLNNAGYDVTTLLAGLGIGGIAVAMAAKDTIANFFGGITILADSPFKLNQRIKFLGHEGFVREIGLRSTRIETLEGRTVVIPNMKFADNPIENVSSQASFKVVLKLGLTYNMNHKKIEKAMQLLTNISDNNDNIKKHLVSFTEFGDSALGILFIYYIKKSANYLDTLTAMNMAILKEFNKNKIEMAFPTQTIHIEK